MTSNRTLNVQYALRVFVAFIVIFGSTVSPKTMKVLEITSNIYLLNAFVIVALLIFLLLYAQHGKILIPQPMSLFLIFPVMYFISLVVNGMIAEIDYLSFQTSARYALTMLVALSMVSMLMYRFISVASFLSCRKAVIFINLTLLGLYLLHYYGRISVEAFNLLYKEPPIHYVSYGMNYFSFVAIPGLFTDTPDFALYVFMFYVLQEILSDKGFVPRASLSFRVLLQAVIIFLWSKGVIVGFLLYKYITVPIKQRAIARILMLPVAVFLAYNFFTVDLNDVIFHGKRIGSVGERLFHVEETIRFYRDNPARSLLGFGPRMYGHYLGMTNYDVERDINAMSIFSILADTGLLGFLFYLAINSLAYGYLRVKEIRQAFLAIFVANLGIGTYISFAYISTIFVLLYLEQTLRKGSTVSVSEGVCAYAG